MLLTRTKQQNKKREIRLSRHDEDSMIFDDNYYFQNGKFHYAVGLVPEPRMRKMIGKKDTYFILRYNDKEVKCLEKVHDLTQATFELSWAINADTYNKIFADMRKALRPERTNKNVQDRKVNIADVQTTEKIITELGILSSIATGRIDTSDLDKSDIDAFVKLEINRTLKRSKKDKPHVILIPERPDTLPEFG